MEATRERINGIEAKETFVRFQPEEKEQVLFPTIPTKTEPIVYTLADLQNVKLTETKKTTFEKIKSVVDKLLDAKNRSILNLWTIFAILFQMASHAHGLGTIFKFRQVPYSFGLGLGLLGSAMFENLLHSLAVRGAFWLPLLLSILSGLFSSYAWSSFASQGNLEYWISQGLAFIPPMVVFWLARNEWDRTERIRIEKENQITKEKAALEEENKLRIKKGLEPKEKPKKSRGRNLSQDETFIIVKTILEKNIKDYKKVMANFGIGQTKAYELLTLASEMKIKKQKESNSSSLDVQGNLRNLRKGKGAK